MAVVVAVVSTRMRGFEVMVRFAMAAFAPRTGAHFIYCGLTRKGPYPIQRAASQRPIREQLRALDILLDENAITDAEHRRRREQTLEEI